MSRMIGLMDESEISNAILPTANYESIKAQLLAAIGRVNAMQQEQALRRIY